MDNSPNRLDERIPNRFWVGIINGAIVVYDAFEQVDLPEIVHLWNLEKNTMGSYKAIYVKLDIKAIANRALRDNAIAQYLNAYNFHLELVNKRRIRFDLGRVFAKRRAAKDRAVQEYYYNPKQGNPLLLFDQADYTQESYPCSKWLMVQASTNHALPIATATAFSQWVYDLYYRESCVAKENSAAERPPDNHTARGAEREITLAEAFRMELGVFGHRSIEELRLWINHTYHRAIGNDWQVIFVDGDPNETRRFYEASRLQVDAVPLRCRPDVVLRNQKTRELIIIERKTTSVPVGKIPAMGWANLKAQLWCYGWIDDWQDAPNVYLIGQFWHAFRAKEILRGPTQYYFSLLDIFPRWHRNDDIFDKSCGDLFNKYGGKIVS